MLHRGGRGHRRRQHNEELACRFCLAGGTTAPEAPDPLIAPCACRGSARFVHAHCLQRWRTVPGSHAVFCPVCLAGYRLPPWFDAAFPSQALVVQHEEDPALAAARVTPYMSAGLAVARTWLVVQALASLLVIMPQFTPAEQRRALAVLAPMPISVMAATLHLTAVVLAVLRLPQGAQRAYVRTLLVLPVGGFGGALLPMHALLLLCMAALETLDLRHPLLPMMAMMHGAVLLPLYQGTHERALQRLLAAA